MFSPTPLSSCCVVLFYRYRDQPVDTLQHSPMTTSSRSNFGHKKGYAHAGGKWANYDAGPGDKTDHFSFLQPGGGLHTPNDFGHPNPNKPEAHGQLGQMANRRGLSRHNVGSVRTKYSRALDNGTGDDGSSGGFSGIKRFRPDNGDARSLGGGKMLPMPFQMRVGSGVRDMPVGNLRNIDVRTYDDKAVEGPGQSKSQWSSVHTIIYEEPRDMSTGPPLHSSLLLMRSVLVPDTKKMDTSLLTTRNVAFLNRELRETATVRLGAVGPGLKGLNFVRSETIYARDYVTEEKQTRPPNRPFRTATRSGTHVADFNLMGTELTSQIVNTNSNRVRTVSSVVVAGKARTQNIFVFGDAVHGLNPGCSLWLVVVWMPTDGVRRSELLRKFRDDSTTARRKGIEVEAALVAKLRDSDDNNYSQVESRPNTAEAVEGSWQVVPYAVRDGRGPPSVLTSDRYGRTTGYSMLVGRMMGEAKHRPAMVDLVSEILFGDVKSAKTATSDKTSDVAFARLPLITVCINT